MTDRPLTQKRIGIIGDGQLARMLILQGTAMGLSFVVFPSGKPSASIKGLAKQIEGGFGHPEAIRRFVESVDVVTYENENVPIALLRRIEAEKPIRPSIKTLEKTRHRFYEKQLFEHLGIPVCPYLPVNTEQDLIKAAELLSFPFIIKSCLSGYDGKHQHLIRDAATLDRFKKTLASEVNEKDAPQWIAETFVSFDYEASIIGTRGVEGQLVFYDLCLNEHHQGILYQTQPQRNHPLWKIAQRYLEKLFLELDYIGTGVLEYFVKDNQLFANEFAPRVHNSGHWTMEGANTSQFENHIRAIAALPLGDPQSVTYSTLLNCIGTLPDLHQSLSIPGLHYHDYKKSPKPKRKLGHITLTASSAELLDKQMLLFKKLIVMPEKSR